MIRERYLLTNSLRQVAAMLAVAAVWIHPLAAQPFDTAVFRGSERITAIDVVVEFEPKPGQEWRTARQIPKDLVPEDFEVLYEGAPRDLVGIEKVDGLGGPGGEPWELVLYFDAVLTSTRGLRQMSSALYERLAELTAFGTVELVWADPEPRTRVTATGDAAPLAAELSEMALAAEGRDELLTLRYQFLGELRTAAETPDGGAGEALGMSPAELARRVAAEEARIVRRQLDTLLARLTAPPDRDAARRAVLLVNDGFDLAPDAFYAEVLDDLEASELADSARLATDTEALARTLAAYGWVTFSLALPPPPPPPPGWRLGKWLFTPAKPQRMDPDPRYHIVDPADRHTERRGLITSWTFIGGLRGRYQEQRNPERARVYLELGRTLTRQGRNADAEEAFRKAIYHFADDRKWVAQQAEALIELGRLLERRGEQEARHAFAEAYQLDPGLAAAQLGPAAALRDPTAPLALLAQATAGWVIQDDAELDRAVATLGHRVRLTYQVRSRPRSDPQSM